MYMLQSAYRSRGSVSEKLIRWTGIISVPAMLVYWITVDYYTIRLAREYYEVIDLYVNKKQSTVFREVKIFSQMPFYTLYTPDLGLLQNIMSLGAINTYFRQEKPLTVIPKELEYVTSGTGSEIGGGIGIRYVGDYLYVEADVPYGMSARGKADFGWLGKTEVILFCYPFISKGDGKKYAYLYLWHVTWELQFAKMKSFELIW